MQKVAQSVLLVKIKASKNTASQGGTKSDIHVRSQISNFGLKLKNVQPQPKKQNKTHTKKSVQSSVGSFSHKRFEKKKRHKKDIE